MLEHARPPSSLAFCFPEFVHMMVQMRTISLGTSFTSWRPCVMLFHVVLLMRAWTRLLTWSESQSFRSPKTGMPGNAMTIFLHGRARSCVCLSHGSCCFSLPFSSQALSLCLSRCICLDVYTYIYISLSLYLCLSLFIYHHGQKHYRPDFFVWKIN